MRIPSAVDEGHAGTPITVHVCFNTGFSHALSETICSAVFVQSNRKHRLVSSESHPHSV